MVNANFFVQEEIVISLKKFLMNLCFLRIQIETVSLMLHRHNYSFIAVRNMVNCGSTCMAS